MSYQLRPITASVFRAYDIRGIINRDLDEDAYYTLGRAFCQMLRPLDRNSIFLARDGRLSSPALAMALKQGLLDSGLEVIDLGAVATPVMYFAAATEAVDSGLMVTGSHNPADYNGIKMVLAGKTLVQEDIRRLAEFAHQPLLPMGEGRSIELDILPSYRQRILRDIQLARPLKVVVDCGNGIAGSVIPQLLRDLGCEVIPLYCEVDGRFPNHHPDPTVESNLADLKASVKLHRADLGLGFDGDADRLGLVTDQGEMITPDRIMMLYVQEVLSRNPGGTVVFDVKCTANLAKVIEQAGGIAKMCPTGHSIVKRVMKEVKAVLAGEMSGHLFFKDRWYGFDDALYAACRLLEIVSREIKPLSELFAGIPNSLNTPELKIDIAEDKKFSFMEDFMAKAQFQGARQIDIDGMRVEFPWGWGLLRASNTTPCLVARFEAESEQALLRIQQQFREEIQRVDAELSLPF